MTQDDIIKYKCTKKGKSKVHKVKGLVFRCADAKIKDTIGMGRRELKKTKTPGHPPRNDW